MLGVYSILLQIPEDLTLEVGSLGSMNFLRGFYVYTGSAMGPGGIGARISRHLRTEKKIFWHIDYLVSNPSVKVFALFRAESKWKMECDVNKSIVSNFDVSIVSGFGSTDCKAACEGHLLFLRNTGFQICLKGIGESYLASGLNPVSTLV